MPVFKTSPGDLHESGMTYVVVPSETISQVRSAEALGVLTYLLDQPPDWTIVDTQLQKRFSLSRKVLQRIVRELKNAGCLQTVQIRDDKKRVVGTERRIGADPACLPYLTENETLLDTQKPRSSDSDPLGT
jgi:isopentenyl diphosphate isomerase/L-lactate dehydrogenase-like FMN-dependent dehydrogenase